MTERNYTEINARTWDDWARDGCPWSEPVTHEMCDAARNGDWEVFLTPCVPTPRAWFGELRGARVLGLASGGGQQMPLLSLAGASCTLLDNSDEQIARDRIVAARENYALTAVKGDMTRRFPFPDDSFDLIFHPVSNCYVFDVRAVWRECARVLRPGGVLLAGFDNSLCYLFDENSPLTVVNKLPYNPLTLPQTAFERLAATDGVQFSHSLEEQIGGQLEAGLCLTALYEDRDRPGGNPLGAYAPQYIATRAVKNGGNRPACT